MGLALAAMSTLGWATDSPKAQAEERLKNAATVLQEIAGAPDKGIPNKVLDGAKCIAVVPRLVQAGFVFGGKHGRGVALPPLAESLKRLANISSEQTVAAVER